MAGLARRMLLLGGVACALAAACQSPTLPLPPPEDPAVDGPTAQGTATLSGQVSQPRAMVYAINWTRLENEDPRAIGGDWADNDGYYRFEVGAEPGDQCELWYEYSAEKSLSAYFEIPQAP